MLRVLRVCRVLTQKHLPREKVLLLTRLVLMQLGPMPAFSKLPFKYLNDTEVRHCVHIHDHKRCNEPLPTLTVWVLRHQWRVRTAALHTVLCLEARQRTTNLLKTLSRSASVAEDAARLMGDSARFSSVSEGTMVHTLETMTQVSGRVLVRR